MTSSLVGATKALLDNRRAVRLHTRVDRVGVDGPKGGKNGLTKRTMIQPQLRGNVAMSKAAMALGGDA